MRPGHVLFIIENNWVPVDRRVWYEATTLRDAGWNVSIICPYDIDGSQYENNNRTIRETVDGVDVFRFPLKFAKSGIKNYIYEYISAFINIAYLSLKARIRSNFDIIHLSNPPDLFFPIGLFYRILGGKFVFDHHDLFPEMVLGRYNGVSGKIFYFVARIFEFLSLHSANIVLASNDSYKKIDQDRSKLAENKVIVVRNGPKIQEFTSTDPVEELRNGYRYLVCFVGIMGEDDGLRGLVESIRYIIKDLGRTDIFFAIVGDGPSRSEVSKNISRWGLERFVDLPGMIMDDFKLRQYISSSDLCVSPEPPTPLNKYSTFIKVGEYMALGKPIVAYDLEETRNTAGGAAVYIHPGDIEAFGNAVVHLLDDPKRRRLMGTVGKQRIKKQFSWEHQQTNLIRAYQQLMID